MSLCVFKIRRRLRKYKKYWRGLLNFFKDPKSDIPIDSTGTGTGNIVQAVLPLIFMDTGSSDDEEKKGGFNCFPVELCGM
jgi:hypothetical protein